MSWARLLLLCAAALVHGSATAGPGPYDSQVAGQLASLSATGPAERCAAAAALGFLRAPAAAPALASALRDPAAPVRRNAALALGWCGSRAQIDALLDALADDDWTVRQAAWVALTNLTGMEFPFDALAAPDARQMQADVWRSWWRKVPADRPPPEVLELVVVGPGALNLAGGCAVTASSVALIRCSRSRSIARLSRKMLDNACPAICAGDG
jgi:hypothetical protein